MIATILSNLDLLAVGLAIAATVIIGSLTYFSNQSSATNRSFLAFSLITACWASVNFLASRVTDLNYALWVTRLVMFFATGQAFALLLLLSTFPGSTLPNNRWIRLLAIPATLIAAGLSLTPYVFSHISQYVSGTTPEAIAGPLIPIWGVINIGMVFAGVFALIWKLARAPKNHRSPYIVLLAGFLAMFGLIIVFNFVLPAFYQMEQFVPLGALFTFPFILATTYAITQYRLFRVRIVSAELFVFLLIILILGRMVSDQDLGRLSVDLAVFIGLVGVGVLLIKNIFIEAEQKEHLEQMTRELQDANIKLKQLDRVRSEFLSFASHQVKAPMSVVKGYAQLIVDGTFGKVPEKVVETSKKIKDSADRLISLVNNLLDLRRIEEGRMEFSPEKTDVGLLVEQTITDLQTLADQKQLTLAYNGPGTKLIASLDLVKFRQVVQNLVENSIKYTEKGSVTVTASRAENTITISVRDTGRGMAPDLIPELFEQFTRERDAAKRIEGTGLGLYIAKQIVAGHKGTISAESDGPGKGSTFTVTIPTDD